MKDDGNVVKLFENDKDDRTYNKEVRMGTKVLTLNSVPMPCTINKSDDFYDGFIKGFERAVAIIRRGNPSAFNI